MRQVREGRLKGNVGWLRRADLYDICFAVLLVLLLIQGARLFWAVLTPVSPLGDWKMQDRAWLSAAARADLFQSFDPFFRLTEGGNIVVTSLALKLYGTRVDEATGRGSAIISGPDGVQTSYAVGEAIMPGVTLKAVAFNFVTIARGGTDEKLYLDQSVPAATATTPNAASASAPGTTVSMLPGSAGVSAPPSNAISTAPAASSNGVRDLNAASNNAASNGAARALAAAGILPGDVITSVNGQPVGSSTDAQQKLAGVQPGQSVRATVNRGGKSVVLSITVPQ